MCVCVCVLECGCVKEEKGREDVFLRFELHSNHYLGGNNSDCPMNFHYTAPIINNTLTYQV